MSLLPTIHRSKTRGELRRRLLVQAVKDTHNSHKLSHSVGANSTYRKSQAAGIKHNGPRKYAVRKRHKEYISQANAILNPPN